MSEIKSRETFGDLAVQLHKKGYSPLPIISGTKRPPIPEWSKYCETLPDRETVDDWASKYKGFGTGIACGSASGIVVVDYDIDNKDPHQKELHKKLFPFIPLSPVIKRGKRGFSSFFRFSGEESEKILLPDGSVALEILSNRRQTVIPGTIHPDTGKPYKWIDKGLLDFKPEELPVLDYKKIEEIKKIIGSAKKPKTSSSKPLFSAASKVKEPGRSNYLTKIAGSLRRQGFEEDEICEILVNVNSAKCEPPLDEKEVEAIAHSISRYDPKILWEEPKYLPPIMAPVPELKLDLVPEPLQEWIEECADQMQLPLDYFIPGALVAAGSLLGHQISIKPRTTDFWVVHPNVWGAVIARPSAMKTPAMEESLYPLNKIIERCRKAHEEECARILSLVKAATKDLEIKKAEFKAESKLAEPNPAVLKSLKAEIEVLEAAVETKAPEARRFRVNDVSPDKLGDILSKNNSCILFHRDELTGLLNQFDKSGFEGLRQLLLEGWALKRDLSVDRITRGTLLIKICCLSLVGTIQPAKINQILEQVTNGWGDDGLLQRLQILLFPDPLKEWKPPVGFRKPAVREEVLQAYTKMIDLKKEGFSARQDSPDQIPYCVFSPDAQVVFDDWWKAQETRLRLNLFSDAPAFESHMGKYRSLIPALALIHELILWASGRTKITGVVSLKSLQWAIRFADLLEAHARKFYSQIIQYDLKYAHALSKKIMAGAVPDGSSIREIYRHHWRDLDTAQKVEKAISILEEYGWVFVERIPTSGRPGEFVKINPKLSVSVTKTKGEEK